MRNLKVFQKGLNAKETVSYKGKNVSTEYKQDKQVIEFYSYSKRIGVYDYTTATLLVSCINYSNTTAKHITECRSACVRRAKTIIECYTDTPRYHYYRNFDCIKQTKEYLDNQLEDLYNYTPQLPHTKQAKKQDIEYYKNCQKLFDNYKHLLK